MNRIHKTTLATAVSLSMAALAGQAQAAGFALMEKNATDLGQAYANLATGNGQASGMIGNPAAMTQIEGTAVSGGLAYIRPSFELQAGASSRSAFGPTVGGLGGDAGDAAAIPNASMVHQLNERTRVGVALTVPFGLATEYDKEWLGRYHGVESHIEVIDISPSISFDLTPEWTVGGAINIQRAEAKLTSAIDGGAACVGGGIAQGLDATTAGIACANDGLIPGQPSSDGRVEIEGDDWSVGYTIGALWQPTDRTRLGVSYHSGIDHKLKGDADYTMPTDLAANPAFADSPASAGLDLPASLSASVTHQFTDTVTGSLGLLWTGWSSFEELKVEQSGGRESITTENWDDTLRVALGGEWQFAPRWTLRAGAAYDPTPVPSAEFRTARLPDADRTWGSIGLGYAINQQWSVDVGYTHIWLNDSTINNTTESSIPDTLQGQYEGEVDILGLQVNARF
ncbi:outer membrane protein transport protein [Guyparkeria halophila]|uniref:Outer membrane protein transport protein n=1 Tax=Guyparkeria halophila TaxID=47960 RepID=A0ABZ0YUC9_9GAMM|nr:outer membrane protein transport protein [Guyparkeria halophila]WQH15779.1 outer membrane protein transport protein [Guyparkeria halophila]